MGFRWLFPHSWLVACCLLLAVSCGRDAEHVGRPTAAGALDALHALAVHEPSLAAMIAPRGEGLGLQREANGIVSEGWRATRSKRFDLLGAWLPDRADGVMDLGASRFDALHVRVTLVGAAGSSAVLDAGRVVYPEALPSTDRVLVSSADALEELLVLRDAAAPRSFTWKIDLPPAIAHVTEHDGGFRFEDSRGGPRLVLAPLQAWDARGDRVALGAVWDDATRALAVSLADDAHPSWPVVIDPRYETSLWLDTALRRPGERTATASCFDAARGELLVFGGSSPAGLLNDTWIWSDARETWRQMFPLVSPPRRFGHAMAYDAARKECVLFGGSTGFNPFADTWAWNGQTWAERTSSLSPPARSASALAYDSRRQEIVLFGGTAANVVGDTWVWNGTSWARRTPAISPSARFSPSLAYDAARAEIVLFGGSDTSIYGDTWVWNGDATTWTRRTPSTSPSPRYEHGSAYDATRRETLIFGGTGPNNELWAWNGTTWTRRTPPTSPSPRSGVTMTFDTTRDRALIFGDDGGGVEELWAWNAAMASWSLLAPSPAPPPRTEHAMAYDGERHEVVLFGGHGPNLDYDETWIWNGSTSTWVQRAPATRPSARSGTALAWDAARREVVLFGGGDIANLTVKNDTWVWNGTTWTQRSSATRPAARSYHALAFDEARAQVVLFGGDTSSTFQNDTWTWDGTTWAQRTPPNAPTARYHHALAYDATRREVVLFGGFTIDLLTVNDTWAWDGTRWAQRTALVAPSPRYNHAMGFDTTSGSVLTFGGQISNTLLRDTWVWTGATWLQRSPMITPPARTSHALAHDAARGDTVLFGGRDGNGLRNDTWVYRTLGGVCATEFDCVEGSSCVDGLCCNVPSCATCETCAGTSPGRCTPVLNTEDPDTCALADHKSCSVVGECKAALGEPATDAAQCASHFAVDGVCCSTAKCGTCQACAPALKEVGNEAPGICTAAKRATDPHDECEITEASTCGHDGFCDGAGRCAFYKSGTACGADRICSGGGECVATAGASCDGDHTVVAPDGTRSDCGAYKCEGAACKTRCTSKSDCAGIAECTPDHACTAYSNLSVSNTGGCRAASGRAPRRPNDALWLFTLAAVLAKVRSDLSPRSRGRRGAIARSPTRHSLPARPARGTR